MIDEKAPQHPPPAYGQPPQGASYNPSQGPAGYSSPQPYPQTPQPYPHTEGSNSYGVPGAQSPQPMGTPGSGPQPGYPPPQMPSQMGPPPQSQGPQLTAGAAYQQQLFALCAAGNHDFETKHGIAGIICAILCFPCGLICLFTDVEKRCVRCGVRGSG
ncbi:uncharacterized protein TRAVEDRAFT_71387 [Trametes versicolor FP-101664 SS1]|uniref:uncharacterized protein n=1 Tax=Trametes versicolor (strain FP-101664) TaxID=717944 RepID=UPI00046212CB|nr:uncharacterized protein TRAVEDRAFT_71387 [Trametes versicolor FP-101664 SS1]EIW59247.1 hypothetical protein TRAVEDRAFT_71387 [Trametes versicolor FP-101664 SS1]